jgi:hypothetical protein
MCEDPFRARLLGQGLDANQRVINLETILPRSSALRVIAFLFAGVLIIGAVATQAGATDAPQPTNPSANLSPFPDFLASGLCSDTGGATTCTNPCVRIVGSSASRHAALPIASGSPACTASILLALNAARSHEGLSALTLPSNWSRLNPPEQTFVIVDIERTARGLPPYLGLNRQLRSAAQSAAVHEVDPNYATNFRAGRDAQGVLGMGSTLAVGYTPLEADYVWMYQDGWGGSVSATPNAACTSARARGCWGHRDELLGYDGTYNFGVGMHCTTCEMGTGFAVVNGMGSLTTLIELPAGAPPSMYFTWAKNVVPFLAPVHSHAK